jgi:hypothetical protein
MGFVTDLFDRIGGGRLKLTGLPPLPEGCEWLIYEQTNTGNPLAEGTVGLVNIELYDPGHHCLSMITVDSTDPDTIRCAAREMIA